jgi:hypothetical protein
VQPRRRGYASVPVCDKLFAFHCPFFRLKSRRAAKREAFLSSGIVFDIKEFAVHDGPGIRIAVHLKGCPLRCACRHNPEGQSAAPQVMHSARA